MLKCNVFDEMPVNIDISHTMSNKIIVMSTKPYRGRKHIICVHLKWKCTLVALFDHHFTKHASIFHQG